MRHCVFEEDEVHGSVELVVALEGVGQDLVQAVPLVDGHVLGLTDAPMRFNRNAYILYYIYCGTKMTHILCTRKLATYRQTHVNEHKTFGNT